MNECLVFLLLPRVEVCGHTDELGWDKGHYDLSV